MSYRVEEESVRVEILELYRHYIVGKKIPWQFLAEAMEVVWKKHKKIPLCFFLAEAAEVVWKIFFFKLWALSFKLQALSFEL